VKEKWPYYDAMEFLEYYLQRRTTTGYVPETATTTEVHSRAQHSLAVAKKQADQKTNINVRIVSGVFYK
jgi:hypothetical protein